MAIHDQRGRSGPQLPRRFGRYVLTQKIAEGGMGEIFVARPLRSASSRCFAVKKVLPQFSTDEEFNGRFMDEARLVLAMRHPNIVSVYEVGQIGRELFMVMELVEGGDLGAVLERIGLQKQTLSLGVVLYITGEVLAALEYCHRRTDQNGNALDVVHRDISPGNVLISFEGKVKITDFGLAASSMKVVKTMPHVVMGKPGYIAPERLNGDAVDSRTDLYNVGILMFELLTGRRFPRSFEPRELLRELIDRPRGFALPSIVQDVVLRALAFDSVNRFQSALEFRHTIEDLIEQVDPEVSEKEVAALMHAFALPRSSMRARSVSSDAPTKEYNRRHLFGGSGIPTVST